MRIDIFSIFPDYLAPLALSLPGKAADAGLLDVHVHDLRQWAQGVHKNVDDTPYGGGPGMVMRPDVWGNAIDSVISANTLILVPTPSGVPFTQNHAEQLAGESHVVFVCGRYEGIDQRVFDHYAQSHRLQEFSLGDYVLIGGEVAALAITEATVRLIPGVIGNQQSHQDDSFQNGLLEGPRYTRPETWREHAVPHVLTTGNHQKIAEFHAEQSLEKTRTVRPDLLADPQ